VTHLVPVKADIKMLLQVKFLVLTLMVFIGQLQPLLSICPGCHCFITGLAKDLPGATGLWFVSDRHQP